jgi:hypothetical protein
MMPTAAYAFAATVGSYPHHRVSQVPHQSFGARCPQSPRKAARLHLLVASPVVTAHPYPGRMGTSIVVSRGRIGFAFAAARAFARQGFDATLASDAACSATCRTSNSHGQHLTVHGTGQASPDAPGLTGLRCSTRPLSSLLADRSLSSSLSMGAFPHPVYPVHRVRNQFLQSWTNAVLDKSDLGSRLSKTRRM